MHTPTLLTPLPAPARAIIPPPRGCVVKGPVPLIPAFFPGGEKGLLRPRRRCVEGSPLRQAQGRLSPVEGEEVGAPSGNDGRDSGGTVSGRIWNGYGRFRAVLGRPIRSWSGPVRTGRSADLLENCSKLFHLCSTWRPRRRWGGSPSSQPSPTRGEGACTSPRPSPRKGEGEESADFHYACGCSVCQGAPTAPVGKGPQSVSVSPAEAGA